MLLPNAYVLVSDHGVKTNLGETLSTNLRFEAVMVIVALVKVFRMIIGFLIPLIFG